MKSFLQLIAFLFLLPFTACAQENKFMPFENLWNKVSLALPTDSIVPSDTMVVLQTNRKFFPDSNQFFSYLPAEDNELQVLLGVQKNGQWKVFLMPHIDSAMSYLPNKKSLMIYVEGLGKNFPIALTRAGGVSGQFGLNVLMIDYPTLHEKKDLIGNFYFAENSARNSAKRYSEILELCVNSKKTHQQWIQNKYLILFYHSLGNALLKEGLENDYFNNVPTHFFDRVVLSSPCVVSYEHRKWLEKLHFSKEIFVQYNKSDFELTGATLLKHRYILGLKPYNKAKNAYYIDFHSLLGKRHNGFLNKPGKEPIPQAAQQYYDALFSGRSYPFNDLLKVKSENQASFIKN